MFIKTGAPNPKDKNSSKILSNMDIKGKKIEEKPITKPTKK